MTKFFKYHGTGNDFILIDDRERKKDFKKEEINKLCDRHFGIGADGVILLRNQKGFDFEMLYYNSDGLLGSMCGNGGRCAVSFARDMDIIKKDAFFTAYDGGHHAEINPDTPNYVRLHMRDVRKIEMINSDVYLDTGSPHYCQFVDTIDTVNVILDGRKIRNNDRFKKDGTNVNFIEVRNGELIVKTYERGVEDETLSCGTGVVASVIAAAHLKKITGNSCSVITPGGKLKVSFLKEGEIFNTIWLEGPAVQVFQGEIES